MHDETDERKGEMTLLLCIPGRDPQKYVAWRRPLPGETVTLPLHNSDNKPTGKAEEFVVTSSNPLRHIALEVGFPPRLELATEINLEPVSQAA